MFKYLVSEVVAIGKLDEDRVYRQRTQKIFDKHGVARKVWAVEGRKYGEFIVEYGEFRNKEEADDQLAKVYSDDEWKVLTEERGGSGTVVGGTIEIYMLNSVSLEIDSF